MNETAEMLVSNVGLGFSSMNSLLKVAMLVCLVVVIYLIACIFRDKSHTRKVIAQRNRSRQKYAAHLSQAPRERPLALNNNLEPAPAGRKIIRIPVSFEAHKHPEAGAAEHFPARATAELSKEGQDKINMALVNC